MAITNFNRFGSSGTRTIPAPWDVVMMVQRWAIKRSKRREIRALLKADAARLTDLGLTRGDVHDALAAPGCASHNLRILAAKRRIAANW